MTFSYRNTRNTIKQINNSNSTLPTLDKQLSQQQVHNNYNSNDKYDIELNAVCIWFTLNLIVKLYRTSKMLRDVICIKCDNKT